MLPLVTDDMPSNHKLSLELSLMADIVTAYEKVDFPIEKPTLSELIDLALEEKKMSQKELATRISLSPSRINDYITRR